MHSQIRRVTVLFVNLGLKEQTLLAAAVYDEAMKEMHQVTFGGVSSVRTRRESVGRLSHLLRFGGCIAILHCCDPPAPQL